MQVTQADRALAAGIAQAVPMNPETHTCPDCGYTWRHGQHGGHSCTVRLKAQRDELLEALRVHHEWSLRSMPGYSEHGDERVAFRATSAAIAKATGAAA